MERTKQGRERSSGARALAWLAAPILSVALVFPACTSSTASKTTGCSLNSDCATGLVCALGKCRSQCAEASDCPVPGSTCIDDGRNAVCESPTDRNTPCASEAQCPVPLACASDYRCRNLCLNDADCNVLGIAGRVCARDMNGVEYCADPSEVANGVITAPPPPGAPSTPVIEPDAATAAVAAAGLPGNLIGTNIGPGGGTIGALGVTVTIPAGALNVDLEITIDPSAQPGPGGTVSPVFEIGPTGTSFALPVTVAFDYTDSELAGLSPSAFAVETTAASLGASWAPLTNLLVDVYAHTIAGQTMHLSPYALVHQETGQPGGSPDAMPPPPEGDGAAQDATADGGGACANACTAGLTQCVPGGVQTCQAQGNDCTAWVTTTPCADHQVCMAIGAAAPVPSCVCASSMCSQVGAVCQDAQTVATCAKDANGCFYEASTSPCTAPMSCSGAAPSAACSLACTDSCIQGQTSCGSGGLATCTLGANGCWAYAPAVACGSHQTCNGAAGAASCTCNADPMCNAAGTTCAGTTSVVTCSTDAQGCVYASATSMCATGCSGGACCTSSCALGQSSCVPGGLAPCTLGADGCWSYAAPVPCGTHQSCTGAAGGGACNCDVSPYCTAGGGGDGGTPIAACADTMDLAICSIDSQNCIYQSGSQLCAAGACYEGGCCQNACPSLNYVNCIAGTPEGETCVLQADGCLAYDKPTLMTVCGYVP
jgi:hypothetical protein